MQPTPSLPQPVQLATKLSSRLRQRYSALQSDQCLWYSVLVLECVWLIRYITFHFHVLLDIIVLLHVCFKRYVMFIVVINKANVIVIIIIINIFIVITDTTIIMSLIMITILMVVLLLSLLSLLLLPSPSYSLYH